MPSSTTFVLIAVGVALAASLSRAAVVEFERFTDTACKTEYNAGGRSFMVVNVCAAVDPSGSQITKLEGTTLTPLECTDAACATGCKTPENATISSAKIGECIKDTNGQESSRVKFGSPTAGNPLYVSYATEADCTSGKGPLFVSEFATTCQEFGEPGSGTYAKARCDGNTMFLDTYTMKGCSGEPAASIDYSSQTTCAEGSSKVYCGNVPAAVQSAIAPASGAATMRVTIVALVVAVVAAMSC